MFLQQNRHLQKHPAEEKHLQHSRLPEMCRVEEHLRRSPLPGMRQEEKHLQRSRLLRI